MKEMEKQSYWKLLPVTFLLLLLAAACVESDVDGGGKAGSLLSVDIPTGVVPLQATQPIDTRSVTDTTRTVAPADSLPAPATRAATVYKRAIVLQYKAGRLINTGSTDINDYTIGSPINALLQEAKGCNIYVLAVNETTTSGSDGVFATEAGFTSAGYEFPSSIQSPGDTDIPLVGSLKGVSVVRRTIDGQELGLIEGSVELSRIAAKLSLNLRFNMSGYRVKSGSGQVKNVPAKMYYVEQPAVEGVFPAEKDASAFKDIPFTIGELFTCYLPANIRGVNTGVTLPKEKYSGTAPKAADDRCTHITFTAEETNNTGHSLTYSFYPGGNNTSDFNIRRNYIYTMTSAITQAAEGDKRITESGRTAEIKTGPMATAVSSSQATLHATLSTFGAALSDYGFYYKAGSTFEEGEASATGATKITASNLASGAYSATLTGLAAKTVYYFRAYAVCGGKTVYGALSSFSTHAEGVLPVLATTHAPVSAVDGLSATSTGNEVTGAGILSRGIVYATQQGFDHLSNQNLRVEVSPEVGSYLHTVTLSNLTKGTVYWYRHYASNAQGYVYSPEEGSFRTKDSPAVPRDCKLESTEANVITFSATLSKKDPADGDLTGAGIRIWNGDPGDDLSAGPDAMTYSFNNLQTPGTKSLDWNGMPPGVRQYWYIFYSTNAAGTEYSEKQTFTTSDWLEDPIPNVNPIGPQGGTFDITTTGRKTTAVVSEDWVTITGDNTDSKTITVAVYTEANDVNGGVRGSTITFTTVNELPLRSNEAAISQYGVVFPVSFTKVENVPASGQVATSVSVTSNITWQATSDQDWCTIDGETRTGTIHTGENTLTGSAVNFTYAVAANTGAERTATITVRGTDSFTSFSRTFTVTQKAFKGLVPFDPTIYDQTTNFE